MENIWFTSDTHFGHKNILRFCPNTRQGNTPDEMNEILIRNWQTVVQPTDRVYMLGDVFFCNSYEARKIMARLPGQKHLVFGNHDNVIKSNKDLRDMFVAAHDYHELRIEDRKVCLFHYPIQEWNGMHHGSFALFGHVHGSHDRDPLVLSGRTMDVGVDSRPNGVAPLHGPMHLWSWKQVKSILDQRPIRPHH